MLLNCILPDTSAAQSGAAAGSSSFDCTVSLLLLPKTESPENYLNTKAPLPKAERIEAISIKLFYQPKSLNNIPLSQVLNQISRSQSKTPRNAKPFLKSLLIPGWGQYSQARKNPALAFFSLETSFWGGLFALRAYGKSLQSDYRAYALDHAGINPHGKNHQFYVDISNYSSQTEYNQAQQIQRDYDALYLGPEYYWQWDSAANRETFDRLRVQSDLYINSAIYFAGAIVINHLVSAIDAARHTRLNDNLKAGLIFDNNGNAMLTLTKGI